MEVFSVGERLMVYRTRAKLTKTELARRVGTSVSNITKYERGEALPDGEILPNLSIALDVTVNKIMFGFDDPAKGQIKEGLIKE